MNTDDIQELIDDIKEILDDDETAHVREDLAYEAVLKAIAEGTCENPQECAKLVLTIRDLDFSRWYA